MQLLITSCVLHSDGVRRRGYDGTERGKDDVARVMRLLVYHRNLQGCKELCLVRL